MPDFADPVFLILLPVPWLVWRFLRTHREAGMALEVPEGIGMQLGISGASGGIYAIRWTPILIWVLLVAALAGPRVLIPNPALPISGRDLVLALDLSGSMVRKDFAIDGTEVSRLDALKHAGTEFVLRRGGDRVGLVVFGSTAYYATPLTHDVAAVAGAIAKAEIGISGRATGISDALGLALKRMREQDANSKIIILLSDGVNNAGPVKPRDAARLARELGVRVHTIAMGPRDLTNADGERDAVDAVTLQAIAELSGGAFFRVKTTDDLLAVTREIDRLEAVVGDGPTALTHRELWVWPAGLAALLTLWACTGLSVPGLRR